MNWSILDRRVRRAARNDGERPFRVMATNDAEDANIIVIDRPHVHIVAKVPLVAVFHRRLREVLGLLLRIRNPARLPPEKLVDGAVTDSLLNLNLRSSKDIGESGIDALPDIEPKREYPIAFVCWKDIRQHVLVRERLLNRRPAGLGTQSLQRLERFKQLVAQLVVG